MLLAGIVQEQALAAGALVLQLLCIHSSCGCTVLNLDGSDQFIKEQPHSSRRAGLAGCGGMRAAEYGLLLVWQWPSERCRTLHILNPERLVALRGLHVWAAVALPPGSGWAKGWAGPVHKDPTGGLDCTWHAPCMQA